MSERATSVKVLVHQVAYIVLLNRMGLKGTKIERLINIL